MQKNVLWRGGLEGKNESEAAAMLSAAAVLPRLTEEPLADSLWHSGMAAPGGAAVQPATAHLAGMPSPSDARTTAAERGAVLAALWLFRTATRLGAAQRWATVLERACCIVVAEFAGRSPLSLSHTQQQGGACACSALI